MNNDLTVNDLTVNDAYDVPVASSNIPQAVVNQLINAVRGGNGRTQNYDMETAIKESLGL